MKTALTIAVLLALTACKDKQEIVTIKGHGGETITISRTAPDAALVSDLKGNHEKLTQIVNQCGNSDSKECASARKARSELAFAKPSDKPESFKHFSGGSRDIKNP